MIRSGYNKAELVLDHIAIMTPTRALWILLVCYHGAVLYTDAAATNKGCNSATECLDNECCISINQPLGRRQLHGHYSGHCVPMGMDGDGCLVRTGNATTRPLDVVLSCPCTPGLYCHGDHLYVVPLGEQGHCTSP